jgi:hypothetical protein
LFVGRRNTKLAKLKLLVAGLMIVALAALVLSPVALSQGPPALYRCTVYQGGVLAEDGLVVKAFVGSETTARAQATTGSAIPYAKGVAILVVPVIEGDISPPPAAPKGIKFTVNDAAATEDPAVDMTRAGPQVRLDVGGGGEFDPWDYDTDAPYGELSKAEVLAAINDYFDGEITKPQALEVVNLYFS